MRTLSLGSSEMDVRVSIFDNQASRKEVHLVMTPLSGGPYQQQWRRIEDEYSRVTRELGLDQSSEVTLEIFFSDITNQAGFVAQTSFIRKRFRRPVVAVSMCQLPPTSRGAKFIVKAYHIRSKDVLHKEVVLRDPLANAIRVSHGDYAHLWLMNILSGNPDDDGSSLLQTSSIFQKIQGLISGYDLSLINNAIRTWIYVRDIDNNYPGMVNSRREHFNRAGLDKASRYIASTGIEGSSADPQHLVSINALFYENIDPRQIKSMRAPGHMNPPGRYGVAFERGLELVFGDRKHMYISGTASIDEHGHVMHVGDIRKQVERTIKNIDSLLKNSGSNLDDLAYLTVYLRDFADSDQVRKMVCGYVGSDRPIVMLRSSVCRPEWLVEIEGVAIKRVRDDSIPVF